MKRPLFCTLIFVVTFPLLLNAASDAYHVDSVDATSGELTVKDSNLLESTLRVLPGADIIVDGTTADFSALQPNMEIKVTFAEPGVAQRIEAGAGLGLPHAKLVTSIDAMPDPDSVDQQAGKAVSAIITPRSPNAFLIKDVRKGVKIEFHYNTGMWKNHGVIPTVNPDDPTSETVCRLAIALPGVGDQPGDTVVLVPPDTKTRRFVFEAQQDYPALALRINFNTFQGPGHVVYDLHITPPLD